MEIEKIEIVKIVIQDWPVLSRNTNSEGQMLRSGRGYVRTKAPRSEREVEILYVLSANRIEIDWGLGATLIFSLKTGRSLGHPDWIIRKDYLTALRKEMKECVAGLAHMERAVRYWMTGSLDVPESAPEPEEEDSVIAAVTAPPSNDVARE